jgi:hypothetical protein
MTDTAESPNTRNTLFKETKTFRNINYTHCPENVGCGTSLIFHNFAGLRSSSINNLYLLQRDDATKQHRILSLLELHGPICVSRDIIWLQFVAKIFRYQWCLVLEISNSALFSFVRTDGYDQSLVFHMHHILLAWRLVTDVQIWHDLNSWEVIIQAWVKQYKWTRQNRLVQYIEVSRNTKCREWGIINVP